MAEDWAGRAVKCECGSEDTIYLADEEDEFGVSYEVFRCNKCEKNTYVELPD